MTRFIILFLFVLTAFAMGQNGEVNGKVVPIVLDGVENASGLAWFQPKKKLFMISNKPTVLYRLDKNGNMEKAIALEGVEDTEGVTWIGENKFAVVEERRRLLTVFELNETLDAVVAGTMKSILIESEKAKNKGLEGVAYDFGIKEFWIVKEKKKRKIYRVPLSALYKESSVADFAVKDFKALDLLEDLSGIAIAGDKLAILSDDSKRIIFSDKEGKFENSIELTAGKNGFAEDVPQAEGIVVADNGQIYLLSEPNLLYILESNLNPVKKSP